jgi:hypothetical protein
VFREAGTQDSPVQCHTPPLLHPVCCYKRPLKEEECIWLGFFAFALGRSFYFGLLEGKRIVEGKRVTKGKVLKRG